MRLCPAARAISVLSALICSGLFLSCGGSSASQGGGGTAKLTQITIAPSNPTVMRGASQQLTATGMFDDGTQHSLGASVTWQTSQSAVATINTQGNVTGVGEGVAQVSAAYQGVTGTTSVTVGQPGMLSITVSPNQSSLPAGESEQLTAIGYFSDGSVQNLTQSATWSSSAPSIATINSAGLASGLIVGSTTIAAVSGTLQGTAMLTVTSPVLASIAVTPANSSIAAGNTQQLTATGTYSDGSTQNLTSTATWSSSASSVATIGKAFGSQGLATAAGLGTTTIEAALGAISGSTTLTVTAGFVLTGSMNTARASHTSTMLNNGMVLIAGGYNGNILASAELYDPASGTFTFTGSLNTARVYHTATLLSNGMVLIAGGTDNNGNILASAELYNPATGTFTSTGSLNTARELHTATVKNGMVLIAGGTDNNGKILASAELYNPTTGTFTPTGSMNTARVYHTATMLNNGMVLIAGGYDNSGDILASAELYNAATGTFTPTLSLNTARYKHRATLLNNGMVLIAGGRGSDGNAFASAELYNPATGTFIPNGSLNTARELHTAMLLNNGMDLIAGGHGSSGYLTNAELNDPATGTFAPAGSMNTARYLHTAARLNNGMGLIAGGYNSSGYLASAELYLPDMLTPPNLVSISLSPTGPTVPLDAAQQFIATGTFSDSSTEQLASVTWSSSDAAVVSITDDASNLGAAYALGTGAATVSACAGAVCGSTSLTVSSAALVSIAVTPATGTVPAGRPLRFYATGTYTDGSTQDLTSSVTWSSSAPPVATINAAGLASGLIVGSTTITAASGTVQGTAMLTVTSPVLASVAVTPANASIAVGEPQQFTATATYSDGSTQNLTNTATWTSSGPAIASVSATGAAVAHAVGTATISATAGSFTGTASLTVTPPVVIGLSVVPATLSMVLGSSRQLQAIATLSDGTTQDMTGTVAWSSTDPNIASVSSGGLVSAAQVGGTTILAQSNGLTGSAQITVVPLVAVSYFSRVNSVNAGIDGTVQLTNPGLTPLCAMVYVFDQNQELNECCGCSISGNGMRTLSLLKDLTANTLTGKKPQAGEIKIVPSDPAQNPQCDPIASAPTGVILAWGMNAQVPDATTETEYATVPLSDGEEATLVNLCSFVKQLGGGQGICSCGSGD
jgi:trimeric autotransporter adhesin